MVVPQPLLDALDESITSGTFIDTKFYVFSRRGASGRVDSPRPLYCNSHVLSTVPYFSARKLQGSPRCCDSNDTDPKYSQIDFQKDKSRTSTGDSPLILWHTLTLTTTFRIATLKMNHLALEKPKNVPVMVGRISHLVPGT